MITFLSGKPGDGKSLYATKLILQDLIEGIFVVTNIPLVLPEVCAYVNAERKRLGDERTFNFDDNCRILSDAEVYEFYRRRSGGLVLDPSPDFECEPRDRLDRPQFVEFMKANFSKIKNAPEECRRAVHYYIDEAHNFFSAREWANAGRGLLYYTSQHRHLWDNIWFITQVVENVEKQLRGLASELHQVRNHLRRSIGPFKLRPIFKIRKFYGVPSDSATTSKPYATEEMTLDPAKVAGCYRTVGALGVQSKPEKIKNAGRLPWWSLWVTGGLVVCAIAAAFLGLPFLGAGYAKSLVGQGAKVSDQITGGALSSPPAPGPESSGMSSRAPHRTATEEPSAPPVEVWVTGYVARGDRINVTLSDGRTLTEVGGDLARIERNFVETPSGERFYLGRKLSLSGLPVPPPVSSPAPVVSVPAKATQEPVDEGAWVRGVDGVSRLKVRPVIGSGW